MLAGAPVLCLRAWPARLGVPPGICDSSIVSAATSNVVAVEGVWRCCVADEGARGLQGVDLTNHAGVGPLLPRPHPARKPRQPAPLVAVLVPHFHARDDAADAPVPRAGVVLALKAQDEAHGPRQGQEGPAASSTSHREKPEADPEQQGQAQARTRRR